MNRRKTEIYRMLSGAYKEDLVSEIRFQECFWDAIDKVARHGSESARKVAYHWIDSLNSGTNNE